MWRILIFVLIMSCTVYARNDKDLKIGIALRGGGAL